MIIIKQDLVNEASEYIRQNVPFMPTTGIILGSGLGAFVDSMKNQITLDYDLIPGWPSSTAPGHAGRLVYGILNGSPLLVMQGRVHLYEGYSMEDVTFPTRVLGQLGLGNLIITNASGGIDHGLVPGDLVLIHDHINFMGQNPLIGPNCDNWGPRFPDMTYAYDRKLMDLASKSACEEKIQLKRGIYIAFSGPSYETPAEIRMSRILGADVVGMSTVPEVIVANHMGMRVCAISCVANYAAGMTSEKLTEEEVLNEMSRASDKLVRLLGRLVETINRN
jgi:purine-nucleoside phosphorylase